MVFQHFCQQHNSHLVSINDAAENGFLKDYLGRFIGKCLKISVSATFFKIMFESRNPVYINPKRQKLHTWLSTVFVSCYLHLHRYIETSTRVVIWYEIYQTSWLKDRAAHHISLGPEFKKYHTKWPCMWKLFLSHCFTMTHLFRYCAKLLD